LTKDERFLTPGTEGEAQKHPGSSRPHWATRVQHSPPLCVLQQQSTCAISRLLTDGVFAALQCVEYNAILSSVIELAAAGATASLGRLTARRSAVSPSIAQRSCRIALSFDAPSQPLETGPKHLCLGGNSVRIDLIAP